MKILKKNLRKNIRLVLREFFLAGKKRKSFAQNMLGTVQNAPYGDGHMYDEEGIHLDDYGYYEGGDDGDDGGDLGESDEAGEEE